MVVVIAIAMLIFTVTTSVLSGLKSSPSSFSAGEGYVISEVAAPTIFSSSVSVDLVTALESFPEITASSPEVFAFSTWNGRSFVLRGVDLDRLNATGPRFSAFSLKESFAADGQKAALVGSRLAARLDVSIPFTMPIVGSYSSKVEFLRLVGTYSTGTSLDDEMIVTLDTARYLSGARADEASIVRVTTSDPEWLSNLLSPDAARFTLFDLHVSKVQTAPGDPVTVTVGVRNWGHKAGTTVVTFSEAGAVLKQIDVRLNASSSNVVQEAFSVNAMGPHSIEVAIPGDFPVRLYANFTIVTPYLRLSAPSKVLLNNAFNVTVTRYDGQPAVASVSFLSQTVTSDQQGRATFTAFQLGGATVTANLSGFTDASAMVTVVNPTDYPNAFNPSVVSFSASPSTVQSSGEILCVVVVENNGTQPGYFNLALLRDGAVWTMSNISLDAMSSVTWRFTTSAPDPGTHFLQVGNLSQSIVVEPWYANNPELVQLVIRYGGSSQLSPASSIPIYRAAKISEGNVAAALFSLGAVSAVLVVLATSSVFTSEIARSRRTLGILRTIGAARSEVWKLVFPQALETGLAGTVIGMALGIMISEYMSRSGVFLLFGHVLTLEFDIGLLLLVLLGSVSICVASAAVASASAGREGAVHAIRELADESDRGVEENVLSDD